ncbi:MAG TPA: hypothetical protein PKC30_04325 [Saprospiraceae bacterium]|nr:hypothetical protein [Saprospiraceae bacterium]
MGCISAREIKLTDLSIEVINLPFKVDSLLYIDMREELLSMDWDVPLIATKSKEWKGNPTLSDNNKIDIERIIRQSEQKDRLSVKIEYRIIEGECQLIANWKSVRELAKYTAEIKMYVPERNITYISYSEMNYDHPTSNVTEKGVMRLYNQAVKNVTHMKLKQIKK